MLLEPQQTSVLVNQKTLETSIMMNDLYDARLC